MDGSYEIFYRNGKLELKRTYKNGELAGPYEEYDEKGYLLKKGNYINGVRTPLERL